jgi:hypothetical protein
MHGKPRDGTHNGPMTILMGALCAWVLHVGGFW